MRGFSYEESSRTMVFDAPNGATFPVSSKVVDGCEMNAAGNDKLDGIMFTMRSEPTEPSNDKLDGIMFTMRSEPTEHNCPSEKLAS